MKASIALWKLVTFLMALRPDLLHSGVKLAERSATFLARFALGTRWRKQQAVFRMVLRRRWKFCVRACLCFRGRLAGHSTIGLDCKIYATRTRCHSKALWTFPWPADLAGTMKSWTDMSTNGARMEQCEACV